MSIEDERPSPRAFRYWVQHADFSTDDGSAVDRVSASAAFTRHDWDAELSAARRLVASGVAVCPPTMCFVPAGDAGDVELHVRPLDWSTAALQYGFRSPRSHWLGFIPRAPIQEDRTVTSVPIDEVRAAIDLFVGSRHAELLAFLSRFAPAPGQGPDAR